MEKYTENVILGYEELYESYMRCLLLRVAQHIILEKARLKNEFCT